MIQSRPLSSFFGVFSKTAEIGLGSVAETQPPLDEYVATNSVILAQGGGSFSAAPSEGNAQIVGKIQCSKRLARRWVLPTLNSNMNRILYAYQKIMYRSSPQTGLVTVQFTIDQKGHAKNSNIMSTDIASSDFENNLNGVINSLIFMNSRGKKEVTVTCTFLFDSDRTRTKNIFY